MKLSFLEKIAKLQISLYQFNFVLLLGFLFSLMIFGPAELLHCQSVRCKIPYLYMRNLRRQSIWLKILAAMKMGTQMSVRMALWWAINFCQNRSNRVGYQIASKVTPFHSGHKMASKMAVEVASK